MSLPTKQNRILPLHCQPNFPGKRTKNMHEKKLWVYPENKIRVFFFTINSVSQARRQKKYVHEKRNDGSTNKTKQKSPTSPSTHFPRQEGKKMCMKIEIMDLPQKDKIQIKP